MVPSNCCGLVEMSPVLLPFSWWPIFFPPFLGFFSSFLVLLSIIVELGRTHCCQAPSRSPVLLNITSNLFFLLYNTQSPHASSCAIIIYCTHADHIVHQQITTCLILCYHHLLHPCRPHCTPANHHMPYLVLSSFTAPMQTTLYTSKSPHALSCAIIIYCTHADHIVHQQITTCLILCYHHLLHPCRPHCTLYKSPHAAYLIAIVDWLYPWIPQEQYNSFVTVLYANRVIEEPESPYSHWPSISLLRQMQLLKIAAANNIRVS